MGNANGLGRLAVTLALVVASCGESPEVSNDDADAGTVREGQTPIRCGGGDDEDADFISTMDEGSDDPDGDGLANFRDIDSDGDTIRDIEEAGDADCSTYPVDTDGDGTADFLDTDSNADGTADSSQVSSDVDGDGIADWQDADVDGDGILNVAELGEDGASVDTDGDGTTDVFDLDADGDNILDAHEGARDPDEDSIPNFRDLDSDGDGISDAIEAGDGDLSTPPAVCSNEIDPSSGVVAGDGYANFEDIDQDNDGLSDDAEGEFGTDLCGIDTDGDGFDDLVEVAYEQVNCPDHTSGRDCGCATAASCGIPPTDYYLVLPYMGEPVDRDLEFGTTIRVADIFFLTDTTGSMGGTLSNVQSTVARPSTGLIERITEIIPDAWFAGGGHRDFPVGSGYGGFSDEAFTLAIRSTPPSDADMVATAFNGLSAGGGADGPESQTEALYQIVTGEGGTWSGSGGSYSMDPFECLDGGWGAACFRSESLPIIVHFTDICAHEGPPGEDTSSCDPYVGIDPAPHTWTEMIAALNVRGAKFVGVNTTSQSCAGVVSGDGWSPCYFLKRTAEETGSVDLDGNALVYDLPNGSSDLVFVDQIVDAITTIATRVPLDVDTGLRDDGADMVDATRFVKRRQPGCSATPAIEPCWTAPEGVEHEQAVAAVDFSTFFGVVPGTEVTFRITFQNDFLPGGPRAQVFTAFIDVRGGGGAVLDTRMVFVVVPAERSPII